MNDLNLTPNTLNLTSNTIANEAANRSASKLTYSPLFRDALADGLSNRNSEKSNSTIEPENEDLRKAFQDFVGQTLFSQMITSMRKTQEGAAYFNGGRAEKIFQGQLDQILSEELSNASASKISDPMFKLFQLRRQ